MAAARPRVAATVSPRASASSTSTSSSLAAASAESFSSVLELFGCCSYSVVVDDDDEEEGSASASASEDSTGVEAAETCGRGAVEERAERRGEEELEKKRAEAKRERAFSIAVFFFSWSRMINLNEQALHTCLRPFWALEAASRGA